MKEIEKSFPLSLPPLFYSISTSPSRPNGLISFVICRCFGFSLSFDYCCCLFRGAKGTHIFRPARTRARARTHRVRVRMFSDSSPCSVSAGQGRAVLPPLLCCPISFVIALNMSSFRIGLLLFGCTSTFVYFVINPTTSIAATTIMVCLLGQPIFLSFRMLCSFFGKKHFSRIHPAYRLHGRCVFDFFLLLPLQRQFVCRTLPNTRKNVPNIWTLMFLNAL